MERNEITYAMLKELWRGGNNLLYNITPKFVIWAKSDGGCWWWIKEWSRKCLKYKVVCYYGSLDHRKKEEYAIQEIPFIDFHPSKHKKISARDFYTFRNLLVEEWLKFINQSEELVRWVDLEFKSTVDTPF